MVAKDEVVAKSDTGENGKGLGTTLNYSPFNKAN